jgi:hypothetical protein
MRTETVSRDLYPFSELSTKAKEKARDGYRECQSDGSYWSQSVIEDFVGTVAPCFGWTIGKARGSRTVPAVYWSGFWSQGDGACFEGDWDWLRVDQSKLADCSNQKLADIMARLLALFEDDAGENQGDIPRAYVRQSGRHSHSYSTEFDCQNMTDVQSSEFGDISRDLMNWLYRALEREYAYANSDECVDENILANEYEFLENGQLA